MTYPSLKPLASSLTLGCLWSSLETSLLSSTLRSSAADGLARQFSRLSVGCCSPLSPLPRAVSSGNSQQQLGADRFKVSSEVVPPLRKPSLSELLKCTESGKLPCHFAVRPVLCTVNSFSSLEGSFFSGLSLPWWLDLFGLLGSVTHSRSMNDVRGGRARVTDPPVLSRRQGPVHQHGHQVRRPGGSHRSSVTFAFFLCPLTGVCTVWAL